MSVAYLMMFWQIYDMIFFWSCFRILRTIPFLKHDSINPVTNLSALLMVVSSLHKVNVSNQEKSASGFLRYFCPISQLAHEKTTKS